MLKRLVALTLTVTILALAGNASALPVVSITDGLGGTHAIPGLVGGGSTNGGAFGADLGNNGSVDFVTFCLERNEYLQFGVEYTFTLDDSAISGGFGGGSPDPLDIRTKNLFFQFFTSTIVDYSNDALHNNALQNAFWYFENEIPGADFSGEDALSKLTSDYINLASVATPGSGSVNVMNLYQNGTNRQSVLHVPEPGVLMLLGSGLLGLGLLRRKVKQA